jgi:uncharacterized glyoxalase superfamily protein PhnB
MSTESGSHALVKNRSVPLDTVLPHVVYQNVAAALAWLTTTSGFSEHYRYGPPDGPVQGAQMQIGDTWIMLESARAGRDSPAQLGRRTQYLTVFVSDVQAHYAQARAAGATIVEDLNETAYGERQYGVEDPEGHLWLFSQHVRDVRPDEWGARVANR